MKNETKTSRPELSFDGVGVNGPDEYRTRIATFPDRKTALKYGPLFSSAPDTAAELDRLKASNAELLAALERIANDPETPWRFASIARKAIAKAAGQKSS